EAWSKQRNTWMQQLRTKCFGSGSSAALPPPSVKESLAGKEIVNDVVLESYDLGGYVLDPSTPDRTYTPSAEERNLASEAGYHIWLAHSAKVKPQELELVVLNVLDENGW